MSALSTPAQSGAPEPSCALFARGRDRRFELGQVDRLHQVPIEPRGLGACPVLRLTVAGDGDELLELTRKSVSKARRELVSVEQRQAEVEHGHFRTKVLD